MSSDFAALGKHARELIAAPSVPMESIRTRSHAARDRGRLATVAVCAAISLGALGAGTGVGAKVYHGVHVWLSGDKVASVVYSGIIMRDPTGSEIRDAVAHATFPVVFPVGLPAGSRVRMVTLAPIGHPSVISVSYEGGGSKTSFGLIDPAVVDSDLTDLPVAVDWSARGVEWRIGGEIVGMGDKFIATRDLDRIKAAMAKASPRDSLTATEALLPNMLILGDPVRLEIAERYRPPHGRSVLIAQFNIRSIPRLAKDEKPMLDTRIAYLSDIRPVRKSLFTAKTRWSKAIAIPAGGVRAIDAVLRPTGQGRGANDCGCEILFNQPNPTTYWIWQIPLTTSGAVRKFTVDARTFAVTS